MNSSLTLSEIWIYPVKSLAGISLSSAQVWKKGLRYDRRFMLIDDDGVAMTQRKHPRMALFQVEIIDNRCTVGYQESSIDWPIEPTSFSNALTAKVWDDLVDVHEVNDDISRWFSNHLGKPCRLVYFPENNPRLIEQNYWPKDDHVGLADAYPLLLIGRDSLSDLNQRLASPVTMKRFRPNLVFSGGGPFVEDTWGEFRIGSNRFKAVKPCARCVLTTVNPETAEMGPEPLRTLSSYRKVDNKVYFGQNIVIIGATEIRTGDKIVVDSLR